MTAPSPQTPLDEQKHSPRPEGTELANKMRALAESGHARAAELREKADAFDAAEAGFNGSPQTVPVKTFMGHWARARRLWSECSGEPLL